MFVLSLQCNGKSYHVNNTIVPKIMICYQIEIFGIYFRVTGHLKFFLHLYYQGGKWHSASDSKKSIPAYNFIKHNKNIKQNKDILLDCNIQNKQ